MGNTHVKPHPRTRNKKQVHWKAAARPQPPGKPQLISETEITPDLVTIRWTKPLGDGGSPISGYLVEHRRTGSPHWVRATPLLAQTLELTISGLEPGWRYQFRVSAENAVGLSDPSDLSEPITVTLQRSAITAPRFTQELQETIALENEKVEFIVHFLGQPSPKICWYKDAFEIFSSRRIRIITESDKSILTIHQCSLLDEGEIKCTATNRAGYVTTKAKLTVEAPPSIRLPRQYEDGLLFEIGELIRLKISVAGRPTPLVFWSHNGESIKNNDHYEVEHVDKCSILKIDEAEREDRGEYQVKAVNKLGEDTQSFLVTVTDKPSPPGKARVVMALGRSVTLSWGMPQDDGGCKIGNYIVEYYRLGWNVWLKAATSRQLTTILGDLIEGSEYKFRVKAESPYGVSDPSEESEVVFIPDPKRGILQPIVRGRSQPKEIQQEKNTPVARRRKNKQRSQSSSRVEYNSQARSVTPNSEIPKRPERARIKSPPKTPEMSPMANRKEADAKINKEIFERSDRSSMARELAYGSPEIKIKKDLQPPTNRGSNYISSSSDISRTPSPITGKTVNRKVLTEKMESPNASPARAKKLPSPERQSIKLPRENTDHFAGSSEFMLVLYPGENNKGHSSFDFDANSIPPPMSLSAPELGVGAPIFNPLRNAASSSELLHEKSMIRLYEAAEAEERELEKHRKSSIDTDIPKIQINSKDEQSAVALERQHSFRRRLSSGGIGQYQALCPKRRHSLKDPTELMKNDILQNKLYKFPLTADEKRTLMMNRKPSKSEEKEEEIFENVRNRGLMQNKKSPEIRRVSIADEKKWNDDYESSTEDDSDSESSEEEGKDLSGNFDTKFPSGDEELETYHPRVLESNREPFEILTKRKDPPSPNFIPKPILKKTEDHVTKDSISPLPSPNPKCKSRSHSPMPPDFIKKERSQSLVGIAQTLPLFKKPIQEEKPIKSRPRSFSLLPQLDLLTRKVSIPEKPQRSLPPLPQSSPPQSSILPSISAVAQISGIVAGSIVIPDRLLEKQKDKEEAKVVIDHYGDIVKNYGGRRRSSTQILDRNSLKNVAENVSPSQPGRQTEENVAQPKLTRNEPMRSIFTDHYNDSLRRKGSVVLDKNMSQEIKEDKTETNTKNVCIENNSIDANDNFSQNNNSVSEKYTRGLNKRVSPEIRRTSLSAETPPKQTELCITSPSSQSSSLKSGLEERTVKTSPFLMRKYYSESAAVPEENREKSVPSPSNMPNRRKVSPSPVRREITNTFRRPMLREIMTQTSEGVESFDGDAYSRNSTPSGRIQNQEELLARAELKVRCFIDYLTDLTMFIVACWLYLFKNELLAIPVLLVMVYRQLEVEISKRIPKWILRRLKRKTKKR